MTNAPDAGIDTSTDNDSFEFPLTPAKVWEQLKRGNDRFVAGTPQHPRQDVERRASLANSQTPSAALFGCADSRLAAEIIFDKGLGDLFVVRNAGQVISDSVVGSLEYAVGVLQVPLILVLGHDECGAVRAAIDSQSADAATLPPHIQSLVTRIVPAVREAANSPLWEGPLDVDTIDSHDVGKLHLRHTVTELVQSSEMISTAIAEGRLAIVGANYVLAEGRAEVDTVVGQI